MSGKCYKMRLEGDTCLYADGHGLVEKENIMICREERERKDKSNDTGEGGYLDEGEHGDFLASVSNICLLFWMLLLMLHKLWVRKTEESMDKNRTFLI